jgi:nucleoside 2-deoxyribosyltransferase
MKDIDNGKYEECTQEILDQYLLERIAPDTRSILQNQFAIEKNQVFIIMKFDEPFLDSAYKGVIKPIINSYDYHPLRIDEIQDSGRITDEIVEEISKSRIVLADLSGERPNCYYEAGFAHALGKEMIFTIKKGTAIHFDLSGYRFIEWETEQELREKLEERFKYITSKLSNE